ncbi:MAG: substrate-binding domain-containing protein [Phycisphaerae bacterium]|nr:substrate-binding domain-containing protein [Phycisphaerae bacterium]
MRRPDPTRQQVVRRIIERVRAAIEQEPLLRRLSGQHELASLLNAPLRLVREALDQLVADGILTVTRNGYHVTHRPDQDIPIQGVVLVNDTVSPSLFNGSINLGVDRACRWRRWTCQVRYVEPANVEERLEELAEEMPGRHVGWALALNVGNPLLRRWASVGRRVVLVDRTQPDCPVPVVALDHVGAARMAMEHLRTLGHRHVGLVVKAPESDIQTCLAEAAQPGRNGSAPTPILPEWTTRLPAIWRRQEDIELVRQWVRRFRSADPLHRPTAVVVRNVSIATHFLDLCEVCGVRVPHELSVLVWGSQFAGEPGHPFTLASSGAAAGLGIRAAEVIESEELSAKPGTTFLQPELLNPGATATALG